MRKFLKNSLLELFVTLYEAHGSVTDLVNKSEYSTAVSVLGDCQDTAVRIGELVEESEGEDCPVIDLLIKYCEELYHVSSSLSDTNSAGQMKKKLDKALFAVEEQIKNTKVKLEIAFLPYKASMWDSLESIWKAADADPDCEAYVVPIPYYDRNPDYSFGKFHYEGNMYPEDVPVVSYLTYDIAKHKPDVIYIHNPYDDCNYVTSVDPRFYSRVLKQYTECLVYVPYYSTSGGMSFGQASCPAYYNADHIVIQHPSYTGFFDRNISKEKFLPTGSPKFDRAINMCKEHPEPPEEWKTIINGRKIYFYNTSIGGMLEYTHAFLSKMKYVFDTFNGRTDACILWRPHPLLESTFASMRSNYYEEFKSLKKYFIENNIGIYDDTPDITKSIAQSEAYIGDAGTSVISLFGVAGKPVFILDNSIVNSPDEEARRAYEWFKYNRTFNVYADTHWVVTAGNHLLYSENNDFKFRTVCRLSDYNSGMDYSYALTVNGRTFVCPLNGYDIVEVDTSGVIRRYTLDILTEQCPFSGAVSCGKYVFLIPLFYPAVVRFDTESGEIKYITEYVDKITAGRAINNLSGRFCSYNNYIYIGFVSESALLRINAESCKTDIIKIDVPGNGGCRTVFPCKNQLWIAPFEGRYIVSYDLKSNNTTLYDRMPEEFECTNFNFDFKTNSNAFGYPMAIGDDILFPPCWSNMFIKINRKTNELTEWKSPVDISGAEKLGYKMCNLDKAVFLDPTLTGLDKYLIYNNCERKLYEYDDKNEKNIEIKVDFDSENVITEETGFGRLSRFVRFACAENAYNSLADFLDGAITGTEFEIEKQLTAYGEISADMEGKCGENTHKFIKEKVMGKTEE